MSDIAPDAAQEEVPAETKRPPLTPKQWAGIEAAWAAGTVTYLELVSKYGRSASTYERHFKSKGILKGSRAESIREKVAEALEKSAITEATVAAARIKETKEDHYKMASALARLTWSEILEAKKNSTPLSVALNNIKALDAAMSVLKKAREERYAVLGLDRPDAIDPDQVPELIISELTAEQVQELRDRDHTEVDDTQTVQSALSDLPDDDALADGGQG